MDNVDGLGRNSWRLRTSDIASSMLSTYLADHCPVVPIALMVSRLWSPRHVLWSNTLRHMAAISSSHTGSKSKPRHDKSVVRSTCQKKSIGTRICLYSRYYSKIARHRATEYAGNGLSPTCRTCVSLQTSLSFRQRLQGNQSPGEQQGTCEWMM